MYLKKNGSVALLIGRLLLGLFQCVAPAIVALAIWEQFEIFAETYGIGLSFSWSRIYSVALLFFGVAIALGVWVRLFSLAAAVCATITLCTSLAFWTLSSYQEFVVRLLFMHACVIVGGLLLFASVGGGKYSLVQREVRWLESSGFENWSGLLARIFIGVPFIWMAICGVVQWELRILFLEGSHIPFPHLAHTLGIMMQFLGGLLVLVGFRHKFGSVLLMIYVVSVLFFVHQPWDLSLFDAIAVKKGIDMETFIMEVYPSDQLLKTQFLFNHLAMFGLLLALFATPLGRYSLENSVPRRRH